MRDQRPGQPREVRRTGPARRPRVEFKRGVRGELLVLIEGRLASLTRRETVPMLRAAGVPIVRALGEVLETGTTEARVEAAWLLGEIGSPVAIPALSRVIEGARWRGDAPVVLRRTTEALVRLGLAGIGAVDRAIGLLAQDDLMQLLLIRHASEQLLTCSPSLPLPPRVTRRWIRALGVYLAQLERLTRAREADKLRVERVILEGYGLSLEQERRTVPALIHALERTATRVLSR